jgi:hypothetical protein
MPRVRPDWVDCRIVKSIDDVAEEDTIKRCQGLD